MSESNLSDTEMSLTIDRTDSKENLDETLQPEDTKKDPETPKKKSPKKAKRSGSSEKKKKSTTDAVSFRDVDLLDYDLSALWDDSDDSDSDKKLNVDQLRAKNKKRRRRQWKRLLQLTKMRSKDKKKVKKGEEDTYRRDIHDQSRLSEVTYTGLETHGTFREDLRTQALVRREWETILQVQDSKGTNVNILDKYMRLSYEEVDRERKGRPANYAPARNMYLAIWNTLGAKPKQKMVSYHAKIRGDGPTLLWFLLTAYHGTAAQIIRSDRLKIEAFKDRLKLTGGCVDKFCEHVRRVMESLKAAGGEDAQAFDKVYEALVATHVQQFNEEIRIWKNISDKDPTNPPTISGLLEKARLQYQALRARKQWPKLKTAKQDDEIPRKRKLDETLVSLLAEQQNNVISAIDARLTSRKKNSSGTKNSSKASTGYAWEQQYGKGKDFEDKKTFMKWLHSEPQNKSKSVTKNGIKWYWCDICGRFTGHKPADCKKAEKAKKKEISKSSAAVSAYDQTTNNDSGDDSLNTVDTFSKPKGRKKSRNSDSN